MVAGMAGVHDDRRYDHQHDMSSASGDRRQRRGKRNSGAVDLVFAGAAQDDQKRFGPGSPEFSDPGLDPAQSIFAKRFFSVENTFAGDRPVDYFGRGPPRFIVEKSGFACVGRFRPDDLFAAGSPDRLDDQTFAAGRGSVVGRVQDRKIDVVSGIFDFPDPSVEIFSRFPRIGLSGAVKFPFIPGVFVK